MKNPGMFIAGMVTGLATAGVCILLTGKFIHKKINEQVDDETERHKKIINKMRDVLADIETPEMISTYETVLENIREMFQDNSGQIMSHIEDTFESDASRDIIAKELVTYIVALDILHEYNTHSDTGIFKSETEEIS